MSMPPSVDAMTATRRASRSRTSAEVELAPDVEPLLDVEAPHHLPLGAGLVRDELHAEHLVGELARLGGAALGELDAAAFAATAGVDLRLDDDDGDLGFVDELLGGGLGLVGRQGRDSPWEPERRSARRFAWPGTRGFSWLLEGARS